MGAQSLRRVELTPAVALVLYRARRSEEARREAIRLIVEDYDRHLTQVPLFSENPDQPRAPTVSHPAGVIAYPYILERLHAVETLPLLVRVFERHQEAVRLEVEQQTGEPFDPEIDYFGTFPDHIVAYACDSFLVDYLTRDDLREGCSDGQREALEEYAAFREEALRKWRLETLASYMPGREEEFRRAEEGLPPVYGLEGTTTGYQIEIMRFAVRFVRSA
jgi:hypothetical protein